MAQADREELAPILGAIIPAIAASQIATGPHSLQCIGAEVTSGSHSAKLSALTNPRLPLADKAALDELARTLRAPRNRAAQLAELGHLELDLREHTDRALPDLAFARFFYAHEVLVDLGASSKLVPFRLRAWGFTAQRPSTPFSPLALRVAIDRLGAAIRARYGRHSIEAFAAAMRGGALVEGLAMFAALHHLDASALWQYDEIKGKFRTIATFGIRSDPLVVPVGSASDGVERRGIVAQLMPERRPVVYDTKDPALWRPPQDGKWEPFDTGLFASHGWRSCMAMPIVCSGRLIGALAAYSAASAATLEEVEAPLKQAAALCADAVLVEREQSVIAALGARYDEELLAANVSLSALSLSHDILHYFGTVTRAVEDATGYLDSKQPAMTRGKLEEIAATMKHTEPSINAMLKLATAARTTTREPQVIEDVDTVMSELQSLLRSILPHVWHPTRVIPEKVVVATKGLVRPVGVSAMSLERIVVNLCVNSAQWSASAITVTGHFNRGQDFELVVRDNGMGIAEADRDRVFDRFRSGRHGSGLGLYVVKSLASRAGGEVYLQSYDESDPDVRSGTIVTVMLPTIDEK